MNNRDKETLGILSFGAIILAVTLLAPQILGLSAKGFDTTEVLTQFFFYGATAVGYLLGIMILFFIEGLITKDDTKYGDTVGFFSLGSYPAVKWFKGFTNLQIGWLSFLVFGWVFLFVNVFKQMTFTGVASLQQAFTPAVHVIFSGLLVPASENLGVGFLGALIYVGVRMMARKYSAGKENFGIFIWLFVPAAFLLYGFATHLLRYSNSEAALIGVLFFWLIGGFVTVASGSWTPFWILHIVNNLYYDLAKNFSKDATYTTIGLVLFIFTIVYGFVYNKRLLGSKVRRLG